MAQIRINTDRSHPFLETGDAERKRVTKYMKAADAAVTQFAIDAAKRQGLVSEDGHPTSFGTATLQGRIFEAMLRMDGFDVALKLD